MNIIEALSRMAGRTDLVAVRREGEVIALTRQCGLKDLREARPRAYIATFGALVGDNWEVIPRVKWEVLTAPEKGRAA
jgi:hypothetical protein